MHALSMTRHLALAALVSASLPALADNCPRLANTTMCVTATSSSGGQWTMNAVFGSYDEVMQDGPATVGGNTGYYRCVGNNLARIVINDSTGDNLVWIARVAGKAKAADGTGSMSPSEGYFRYKAVAGGC